MRGVAFMILARLWHNRRLVATTFLGLLLAVAVVSSIPIYADGALQRILTTELSREETPGRQPAGLEFSYYGKDGEPAPFGPEVYPALHRFMTEEAPRLLAFQPDPFLHAASLDVTFAEPADPARLEPKPRWLKVGAVQDLQTLARLADGRFFAPAPAADGAIEAVITESMSLEHDLTVGAELLVPVARGSEFAPKLRVRVVGIIATPTPGEPLYYVSGGMDAALLTDMAIFRASVLSREGAIPYQFTYYYGLQAAGIRLANLNAYLDGMYTVEARAGQIMPGMRIFASPRSQLYLFTRKSEVLRLMLLVLNAPLLALVGYYTVVTAALTVAAQRGEIAVLRSRGASLYHLLAVYLAEGLLVAGAALLLGLFLGLWIARAMGAAAGFVQFVDRRALPVLLTERAYLYAAATAAAGLVATLAPALLAARESIISYKQQQARTARPALWHRLFLDLLLIGLGLYGWFTLSRRAAAQAQAGAGSQAALPEMLIDPLHFLLPAVLIAGLGLLLLRILPWLMHGLERLTRRRVGAALHLALTRVARAPSAAAPVILLLTLTVGLGLFSATAARTLEQGYGDRIAYQIGSDLSLWEVWEYDETDQIFREPPWAFHREIPGVVAAARVRVEEQVQVSAGGRRLTTATRLMAIDGPEFAATARLRRDLTPYHLNAYINLLTRDQEAALVSSDFLATHRLRAGDRITLVKGGRTASLVIFGSVPYWPGLEPGADGFVVANLDPIQDQFGLQPYLTWLRMADGAGALPVLEAVQAQRIPVLRVRDARSETAAARRDPQRTGLYGALTIGFIISAGLTVLGFLLHGAISLRSRLLEMGVLRAMGLSVSQLLTALALEQGYSVGVGMAAGTGFGLLAARLFLPLLKLSSDLADSPLAFRIVSEPVDQFRLFLVLGLMLLVGLLSLGHLLRSLQIHQAVKLGEDG